MKQLFFGSFFVLSLLTNILIAAPITSTSSGNWSNPLTWSGATVPGPADVVTIANGHTITVDINASCLSLNIGNGALNANSSLNLNTGITLTIAGIINILPPSAGTTDNTLNVGDGNINCTSVTSTNSGNNSRRCLVNINSGHLSCSGDFAIGANINRNKLTFTGSGLLQIAGIASTIANGQFTAATGTIEYNATAPQNILSLSYHSLQCSGTGIKALTANTTLTGDLTIAGTSQLDVTTSNKSLSVAGNWTVTSSNVDPFIERTGTVTFNGNSGTQVISTSLGLESFYNLTINNSSGTAPGLKFNCSSFVEQAYTQSSGNVDLNGHSLIVISGNNTGAFINCSLDGGTIVSSVSGAQVSFSDANDSTYVNINGFSIGDQYHTIPLTINTGRINIQYFSLHGNGNFTKKYPIDDASAKGGNKYYNNVTFTATNSASRWRMSTGTGASPDSFFAKATFNAYANGGSNNNFILGANSVGNYYADSVFLTSTTSGGLYIGRQNGASYGTTSSHFFNGHVEVLVTYTGNINFANAIDSLPSSVVFNSTLRLNSTNTSTGDIYIGNNNPGSTVSFTTGGELIDGTITGATNIYFYNVTQNGYLLQSTTNSGASNSSIIIGSSTSPCTWNAPVAFTAPNINLAYSNYNGFINIFNMNGSSSGQNCTGGNTFATNSNNIFTNSGTVNWNLAYSAPDTYNGNVYFTQLSTGLLRPSYNTNCTYAGNIYIQAGSDSIAFAAGANGRVTINGNNATAFYNSTSLGTSIKRLTINKAAGNFTLNKTITIPSGGDLSLIAGKLISNSAGILRLMDGSCTVTHTTAASSSYVDGPLQYDITSTSPVTLHFPIGKGNDSRPVQLNILHSTNITYSYRVEVFNTSAQSLGWALPFPINNVSSVHYWDINRTITSTGATAPSVDLSGNQTITLFYGANDNVMDTGILKICKNTFTAPSNWINIGGAGDSIPIGKISSTSSPSSFNSFSRFTLANSGQPLPPLGRDSTQCGTGSVLLIATPVNGESVDWYSSPIGGTAIASSTDSFYTPSISVSTIYYAAARNSFGFVSATRTPVTATIHHTASFNSFSPTSGSVGSTIIINGSNFLTVNAVNFGTTPATAFSILSDTVISVTVPVASSDTIFLSNYCGVAFKTGFNLTYITTWTGASDITWTNPLNWDNGVPDSRFITIINNTSNTPLIASNQAIKSLNITPGANLYIAVSNSLSVTDSLTNNGIITGTGTIALSGTTQQIITGNGSLYNLSLNNNNGAIISADTATMVNVIGRITPTNGILTSNGHLTLKSDINGTATIGTGSAAGGYINGLITMERFVPARRAWRLIGFPVTPIGAPSINQVIQENAGGYALLNPHPGYGTHITGGSVANGFDQNTVGNPSLDIISGNSYVAVTTTNQAISNFDVYFLFVRGSRANNLALLTGAPADNTTLRVAGNLKQGNQLIPIFHTGWYPIANPFASRIDLDNIAVNNASLIGRNFIYWDPKLGGSNNVGGYVTLSYNGSGYDYTPTPVSALSEYAQSFTAFYVNALSTGNLAVNETNKCSCGNDNVFRPATPQTKLLINLHSYNNDGTQPVVDAALTAFDDRYSNNIDKNDALKLENGVAENLSILNKGQKLAVDRRSSINNNDTIQLNLTNILLRNYQLEIVPINFTQPGLTAFLEDKFLESSTAINLFTVNNIDFSISEIPSSYDNDRFRVVFKNTLNNTGSVTVTDISAEAHKNAYSGKEEEIEVAWNVMGQQKVSAYQIEHSTDNIHFSVLGSISNIVNPAGLGNYNFTDNQPVKGINYYRIKIIDNSGGYTFSGLAEALFNNQSSIQLLQNPVINSRISLSFTGQVKGEYQCTIFDYKGAQVMRSTFIHDGQNRIEFIPITGYLPNGIYHLVIKDPSQSKHTFRVSIEQ